MQGSAVALGILLALTTLKVNFPVECWLALARNHIGPRSYKPNDIVTASDGTSIEVVHTEGKDKNGQIIGVYSEYTEKVAKESGINNKIAGQPYNLDWTGQLKRQTDIKTRTVTNDVLVQIDSSSPTLLPLFETIEKYGFLSNPNTIFGYQPQKKDVVINIIKTTALSKLKRKLNV